MGALAASVKGFLAGASVRASHVTSFFSHNQHLHTSRFARLHEHAALLRPSPEHVQTGLLFGISHLNQTACVRPTPKRRELGNMLVCAPPRSGKSLLAISQLLTWPHSVIVNDVKGELHAATAGYRKTFSDVFVGFDHGVGHPLLLLCNAKAPNYRKNKAFKYLDNYSEWPKVADAVIEALRMYWEPGKP